MFKFFLFVAIAMSTIHCIDHSRQLISIENLFKPSDILKALRSSPLCAFELVRNSNFRELAFKTTSVVAKYHPASVKIFTQANRFGLVYRSLSSVNRLKWMNRIKNTATLLAGNLVAELKPIQERVQDLIRYENRGLNCGRQLHDFITFVLRLPRIIIDFLIKLIFGSREPPTTSTSTEISTTEITNEFTKDLTTTTNELTSTTIEATFKTTQPSITTTKATSTTEQSTISTAVATSTTTQSSTSTTDVSSSISSTASTTTKSMIIDNKNMTPDEPDADKETP